MTGFNEPTAILLHPAKIQCIRGYARLARYPVPGAGPKCVQNFEKMEEWEKLRFTQIEVIRDPMTPGSRSPRDETG